MRKQIHFTRRELEVLKLVAEGYTNQQIADMLIISIRTANKHVEHIFGKIGCTKRYEVIIYAIKHELYEKNTTYVHIHPPKGRIRYESARQSVA